MPAAPASFSAHYQSLVASGTIEADAAQARAVEALAALDGSLGDYEPSSKQNLFSRLFAAKDHADGSVFSAKRGRA